MPFVNELIPEDEKSKFDFPVRTVRTNIHPTLYKWVIDRDRNAFLVKTHARGLFDDSGLEEAEELVLVWQGEVTKLRGKWGEVTQEGRGKSLNWRIYDVRIPLALAAEKDEVLELIIEAFKARSWPYRKEKYESIEVSIEGPVRIMKELEVEK